MSVQCQIMNMDGNHRVMENDHILVAMFHNYWEYSVFFLLPRVQKERGLVTDGPPLLYWYKECFYFKRIVYNVMKAGPMLKGLFLQLGRLVQPIAIITSTIQPIWLPLLLPRLGCNPGV